MSTETLNIVKPSWGADNHQRESFVNRLVRATRKTTLKIFQTHSGRRDHPPTSDLHGS